MNTKRNRIIYYVSTGLLTAFMAMAVGMYFFQNEMMQETFIRLAYPTYIIYPLATAKTLGLFSIWIGKNKSLKEWAYAGFFFDFILATSAHLMVGDGEFPMPITALVLLLTSYFSTKILK